MPSIGLAILFFGSLAGLAGQFANTVAVGEIPLVPALWLAGVVASAAGLGYLAAGGPGRKPSAGGDAASVVTPREVLDKVPLGLAVYGTDGRLAMCNGLWLTALADEEGFTEIGSAHDDCMHSVAGGVEPAPDGHKIALAGVRQLDGGTWVRFDEVALNGGGTLVTVHDITEERMHDSGARSERERARLIISAAGAWIWETDVLNRFSLAVPVRSDVTRDDLGWMIGRGLSELTPPGGGDTALSKCLDSMQGHRRLTDAKLILHDGTRKRPVRLSGVPRIDDDGIFLGYCGVGIFDTLQRDEVTAPPPAAVPGRRSDATASLGKRVLLVDDSQTNRMLGVSILEKMGYECDTAETGQQAVEAVQGGGYGLVLMDIRMPGMDGFETTSQIRALEEPGRSIPVVAMTAHMNPEDRQLCLDSGMDDHVSKPVDRRVLSSVLHRLIGPPHAGGENGRLSADTATGDSDAMLADHAVLEQLRSDAGPEMVAELIASFMTETDERLDRMQAAVTSGDLESISAEAHAMKSSSGTFGALRLQRHVERLEAAATSGDADLVSELLGVLPDLVAKSWCEFARAGYPPPI